MIGVVLYPHVNSGRDTSHNNYANVIKGPSMISLPTLVPQYPLNFSRRLIMAISHFPTFITQETQ